MQIRCNFPDISYLSETQKINFQFLNNTYSYCSKIIQSVQWHLTSPGSSFIEKMIYLPGHFFSLFFSEKLPTLPIKPNGRFLTSDYKAKHVSCIVSRMNPRGRYFLWDKHLTPSKGRKTLPLQSYEGLIRLRGYSCNNYSALLLH